MGLLSHPAASCSSSCHESATFTFVASSLFLFFVLVYLRVSKGPSTDLIISFKNRKPKTIPIRPTVHTMYIRGFDVRCTWYYLLQSYYLHSTYYNLSWILKSWTFLYWKQVRRTVHWLYCTHKNYSTNCNYPEIGLLHTEYRHTVLRQFSISPSARTVSTADYIQMMQHAIEYYRYQQSAGITSRIMYVPALSTKYYFLLPTTYYLST